MWKWNKATTMKRGGEKGIREITKKRKKGRKERIFFYLFEFIYFFKFDHTGLGSVEFIPLIGLLRS